MFAHYAVAVAGLSMEPLSASGRSSDKLSLPFLRSKVKCDPDGYEAELTLIYKQFNSALDLFQQQAALNFGSISGDPNVAKDLGDRAMFLAHVMPFYRKQLAEFPSQQGFAEKLFSRLQTCNERFEVKMMMLKLIAGIIGLHRLILLNFYPFLLKYVQPHQRDITNLLAVAVQACHDMVPPDVVEPLFKQIVNQFVHDRSRTEV